MKPEHEIPDEGTLADPIPDAQNELKPDVDRELATMAARDAAERKRLRLTLLGAAVFHIVLLIVTFPQLSAEQDERPLRVSEVFVVQQVRFKPPAPRREEIPKRKKKKIPIPDPTPQYSGQGTFMTTNTKFRGS